MRTVTFLVAGRLLLCFLLPFLISVCLAASPVETEYFTPPGPNYRLVDVIPRVQGGSYVLVAGQPITTRWVFASITLPPGVPGQPWFDGTSVTTGALLGLGANEVLRVDGARKQIARLQLGTKGITQITKSMVDSDGSLVFAGFTDAEDFPATGQLFPALVTESPSDERQVWGFVARTNPAGTKIERAVLIGGIEAGPRGRETIVRDVARDRFGNLYLVGNTTQPDFPTTADAAKTDAGFANPAKGSEGFVLKVDRNMQRVFYSTFVGSDEPLPTECGSPDVVAGSHWSIAQAVRVDAQQQAVVYVATNGKAIPSKQGAVEVIDPVDTPQCQVPFLSLDSIQPARQAVSLLRLNATGSEVSTSAYLGRTSLNEVGFDGAMLLQQNVDATLLAVLPAAQSDAGAALRLMKLDASLGSVLAQSELAGYERPNLYGLALQPDGAIWLAGIWRFPVPVPEEGIGGLQPRLELGRDLLMRLRGLDLRPDSLWLLPNSVAASGLRVSAFSADLLAPTGVRTRFPLDGEISPAVLGYSNAAGNFVKATVSPYEFVSLYGTGLGPATGAGAMFDAQGLLPTLFQGVSVRMDGVSCPLLYVSDRQVNLIAPAMLADKDVGSEVLLEVLRDGVVIATRPLAIAEADPHFFQHSELERREEAIALNEDGAVNSMDKPARAGEAVVLFLNGAGAPPDRIVAGRRVNAARDWSPFTPSVRLTTFSPDFDAAPVERFWPVEYFGSAPTLAAGTLQLNVRIPADEPLPVGLATPTLRFATFSLETLDGHGEPVRVGSQSLLVWMDRAEP